MAKKAKGRPKHIPQRTCVICRQKYDKRRLTRIVRTPDQGVVIDPTGKRNGRGAYICDQTTCWDKVIIDFKLLNQALMTEISSAEQAEIATYRPANDRETE